MFRYFGLLLLAGPVVASFSAAPAAAQHYPTPPPGYYRVDPPGGYYDDRDPPPAYSVDEDDDDQPMRETDRAAPRYSQVPPGAVPRAEDGEAPPPPGFVPPTPAQQGFLHQPAPAAANDPSAPRPPGAVGPAAPAPQGATTPPAPAGTAALPPDEQPETGTPKELPPNLRRQLVDYPTKEPAGTIIVDTAHTYLYLVLGGGKAIRYGVRVGREGFTWTGVERISKMKEWPDWFPPPEMIERQPYLPRMMAGGPGNPLGARAMYLGNTLYRIHGTNQPSTIGHYVSSGCVGMLNEDVEDLYSRVQVGTRVVVLPGKSPENVAATGAAEPPANPMAPPGHDAAAVTAAPLPAAR